MKYKTCNNINKKKHILFYYFIVIQYTMFDIFYISFQYESSLKVIIEKCAYIYNVFSINKEVKSWTKTFEIRNNKYLSFCKL